MIDFPAPVSPVRTFRARAQGEREILDDGEVPDPELDQHGRLVGPVEHSPQPVEKGLSPEADELDALLSLLDREPVSGGQRVRLLSVCAHRQLLVRLERPDMKPHMIREEERPHREGVWGEIGVTTMQSIVGAMMGPPAERE